jgi:hypothetical protein
MGSVWTESSSRTLQMSPSRTTNVAISTARATQRSVVELDSASKNAPTNTKNKAMLKYNSRPPKDGESSTNRGGWPRR